MQNFRADIEGLRAVAVILVLLYHFGVPGIPGGFVGVDVFFVISGFVITQLLNRSFAAGTFRFSDFYARRIRRLVPVFLLVSIVSFLLISPFYLDDDYYIFAKSWLASLVGLSNFFYFAELSKYFSPEAQSLTLLHTWSLAVEEQFYLLWPASLFLAYRFFPGRRGWLPFTVLWLLAFAWSIYLAQEQAKAAYYLLPARLFELMLGAGVALFATQLPILTRPMAQGLSALGLGLIVATALRLHNDALFPGYNALSPTVGAALILYAGLQQQGTVVFRLLSQRPMVWLGGLSYSLYLWHWPPVALLHYQLIELTWLHRVGLIAMVIALSWLSHRFVENRFRYLPWGFRKSLLVFVVGPMILIWLVQVTIRVSSDISFRMPEAKREIYRIVSQHNAGDLYKKCFKGNYYNFDQSQACRFGVATSDGKPNTLLIGDSHATSMIGFVEQLIAGTDRSLLLITQASTPFVRGDQAPQIFPGDSEKIDRSHALTAYLTGRPMTVFVAAWWNSYLRNPQYERYFVDALAWLQQQGHTVIVIEDVPQLPSASYAYCLLKNMPDCSISAAEVNEDLQHFLAFKARAQTELPTLIWLNPRAVFCDAARCQTVLNGIPLYRDESHLNNVGSTKIGRLFREKFGSPVAAKPGVTTSENAL